MKDAAIFAEQNELIRLADLARGFAGMTKGPARETFKRKAYEYETRAMALSGSIPADITDLSDDALLAALMAD